MRRLILAIALVVVAVSGQTWKYGPESNFRLNRFDGEYFPQNGEVYFLGGLLADSDLDGTVHSFNPATQTYGTPGATMPTPVSAYEAALLRDYGGVQRGDSFGLYAFGGLVFAGRIVNTVQCYRPWSNTVTTVTSDPYPGDTGPNYSLPGNATVYNNKAYVLGGCRTAAPPYVSGVVCVYDPLASAGSRWTRLSYWLNHPRGCIMGAVVDSFLYACGGDTYDGTSFHARAYVERLNLSHPGAWVNVSPMPQACDGARAFGFNTGTQYFVTTPGDLSGKIVIAGHGVGSGEDSLCFIYDVAANTWSSFPNLARACRGMAGAFLPGRDSTHGQPGMWLWGGEHRNDGIVGDTAQFFTLRDSTSPEDVGCACLLAPTGSVPAFTVITPACSVCNHGPGTETYPVRLKIATTPPYDQTVTVTGQLPGTTILVTFPAWTAAPPGGFCAVTCSTGLAGDWNGANDKQTDSVRVAAQDPWTYAAALPYGARGKRVKDGGALAYSELADTGFVWCLKGNNTNEFYRFNTMTNTWLAMDSLPLVGSSGKQKRVKKGSVLVADNNGMIYAAKGNTSLDWWQYDPGARVWSQEPAIPVAAPLKEGAGAALGWSHGTPYIYLLKGSGTFEFYRYNELAGYWQQMADAPLGATGKSYKNGSCLASDGAGTLYCLKGSNNEFFGYSADDNQWITRLNLPLVGRSGRKKKAGDGAGIAGLNGYVYCQKGNGTDEFFRYATASDAWSQLEDVPISSGKAVKGGGALVATRGAVYSLKGNSTLEFNCYVPPSDLLRAPDRPQPATESNSSRKVPCLSLVTTPNPSSNVALVTYSLSRAGPVSLNLYDVSGRMVTILARGNRAAGTYQVGLSAIGGSLSAGVYVLKYETEGNTLTSKLIIE